MTRGRCGSLFLHRGGLSPPTSCRCNRRTPSWHACVRARPRHWLVWGFSCQGPAARPSLSFSSFLCILSFVRPRRRLSSAPTARDPKPTRATAVKDGGFFSAAGGLSLTDVNTAAWSGDRGTARLMIRGEPALCASETRAPHACNRLGPRDPDHEAVIRFCGQGSEAAVPFSQRHIAAIAVFGLPPPRIVTDKPSRQRDSVAEPCMSFPDRESCLDRRPQHDAFGHLAGRDQTPQRDQQFACERHNHSRLTRAAGPLGPQPKPF